MCGRYSNAQSPYQFTAAVRDLLQDHHLPEQSREAFDKNRDIGAEREQKKNASQDDESNKDNNAQPLILSRLNEDDYHPTHNVSPSSRAPILRLEEPVPLPLDGSGAAKKEGHNLVIECMRWGLLPARTQFIPHGADALKTINARDDSVMSGQSMWTPLLKKGKRCIVFCQGFYEWLKKPDGTRIAHFCGMHNEGSGRLDVNGKQRALMPMAGLYEQCTIDGQVLLSFTIITTDSNKQLNFLHDRMPVILPDVQSMLIWLGVVPASSREVCSLLKPYNRGDLDLYPVPREVGKVGNDDKNFILPVSSRRDGIAAAFGRAPKVEKDVNSETHAPLEEEIKAVDGKRKRQVEDDEKLAKALQKDEEDNSKRFKLENDAKVKEETSDVIQNTASSSAPTVKAEEGDEDGPSSRFSPQPLNPPISPPRPNGGYSTSTHDYKEPLPRKAPNKQLAEAAKGSKDIRNFFGSK